MEKVIFPATMTFRGDEKDKLERIIKTLRKNGIMTEAELYRSLGVVSRSTLQYQVNKLEQYNMIKREKVLDGHKIVQNVIQIK